MNFMRFAVVICNVAIYIILCKQELTIFVFFSFFQGKNVFTEKGARR